MASRRRSRPGRRRRRRSSSPTSSTATAATRCTSRPSAPPADPSVPSGHAPGPVPGPRPARTWARAALPRGQALGHVSTGRDRSATPRRITRQMQHFAQAAEDHLAEVYGYLVYMPGDRGRAEELASAPSEKACRAWARFDPRRAAVGAWLCTIARSVAFDHFRAEEGRRRREDSYALRQEFE